MALLDQALAPYRKHGTMTVPNLEMAALQLRKVYELIAFASIAANKSKYADFRAKYEKSWNLAEILKVIERFNPKFLPVRFEDATATNNTEMLRIVSVEDMKYTRENLSSLHGALATILHAHNPYKPHVDYPKWFSSIAKQRDDAIKILSCHTAEIVPDKLFYRVVMNGIPTGEIQVAVMEIVGEAA